ncbi:hypothetical protein FQN50_001740 [Emmonsiellopsis sp. PD_5]|nr:hypothetical protein FQN50_001740 [Emmonsiellopsis sp. PD_5]
MTTQGGLINTPALALQYYRAKEDPHEDSTIGLWDRLFNKYFEDNIWIVTPQKRQPNAERPDFIIEKLVSNNQFVEVIVVEGKPQEQTMSQDYSADIQVLNYARTALQAGMQRGQRKIFALRVVGVNLMAYRVTANDLTALTPLATDYMDPKQHHQAMLQVFQNIKTADVMAP